MQYAETSNETNKSFFTNVCVLLFISNLYLKKFKQLCLGELLIFYDLYSINKHDFSSKCNALKILPYLNHPI